MGTTCVLYNVHAHESLTSLFRTKLLEALQLQFIAQLLIHKSTAISKYDLNVVASKIYRQNGLCQWAAYMCAMRCDVCLYVKKPLFFDIICGFLSVDSISEPQQARNE